MVTGISPSPVVGSKSAQAIVIHGQDFRADHTVRLYELEPEPHESTMAISAFTSTSITVLHNFGIEGRPCSVKVIDSQGRESARVEFAVVAPSVSLPPPPMVPETPEYAATGNDGLVLVTHGCTYLYPDQSWVSTMANAIASRLGLGSGWDVVTLWWPINANTLWPGDALANGISLGVKLGDLIYDHGYRRIHLIGHSAGAGLVQSATERIRQRELASHRSPALIHSTFLDAYVGVFTQIGTNAYGYGADWADQYVAIDYTLFFDNGTNEILSQAFNLFVTPLDRNGDGHSFPHIFYLQTILANVASGFGFPLSVEAGGSLADWSVYLPRGHTWNLSRAPDGSFVTRLGRALSIQKHLSVVRRSSLDFSAHPDIATPDAASLTVAGTRLDLVTTRATYAALAIPVDTPTNALSVKITLVAPSGGRGQLSLYWNNVLLGAVDSRFVLDGPNRFTFPLPGEFASGSHILAIRLDATDGATLRASLDDVVAGHSAHTH